MWLDEASTATLTGDVFSRGTGTGGQIMLSFTTTTVSGCSFLDGGQTAMRVTAGTTSVSGSTFRGNAGTNGGAMELYGDVDLDSNTFEANTASGDGGAIYAWVDESVADRGSVFIGNETDGSGGAIYTRGSLSLTDTVFSANVADYQRATIYDSYDASPAPTSVFTGCTIDDGMPMGITVGGGVYVGYGALTVVDSTFSGNEASGGAIYDFHGTLDISGSRFSNNVSTNDGGAVNIEYGAVNVTDSVFSENVAANDSGGLNVEGAEVVLDAGYSAILNTTFVFNATSAAVDGHATMTSRTTYSNFYGNSSGDASGAYTFASGGFGNVSVDPAFVAVDAAGDCFTDSYALASGSRLIDAGDPSLSDPDGSRSDIGAIGGPSSSWVDTDGDGRLTGWDCDEGNDAVNPGATEVCNSLDDDCNGGLDGADATDATAWYPDVDADGVGADAGMTMGCAGRLGRRGGDCDDGNPAIGVPTVDVPNDGSDQDCDGADLADVDGDSYAATTAGGPDCADTDPGVHPRATDIPDDAIDQDCDGFDATAGDTGDTADTRDTEDTTDTSDTSDSGGLHDSGDRDTSVGGDTASGGEKGVGAAATERA